MIVPQINRRDVFKINVNLTLQPINVQHLVELQDGNQLPANIYINGIALVSASHIHAVKADSGLWP